MRAVLVLAVTTLAGALLGGPAYAVAEPTTAGGGAATTIAAPGDPSPDFDGDGYGDLVVGSGHDNCAPRFGPVECGSITVFYGGADGPVLARTQQWDQGRPGIPGARQPYDLFGFASATGDLDADGFDDVAVGIPFDGDDNAGSVAVLYGSAAGLSDSRAALWSPRTDGVLGESRPDDQFGRSVAIGDVDGDSYADLVVGMSPPQRQPAIHVLYGASTGITADGNERREGLDGGHGPASGYGRALAVADFDADGFGDIAVGVERAPAGGITEAGAVEVVPGGPEGIDVAAARTFSQATAGVLGAPLTGDAMGADLDAADFDGDGFADLAIGAPGDSEANTGAVNVLYGDVDGLGVARNQLWTAAGPRGPSDEAALTSAWAGDLDGDGLAELVIGAPGRYGGRFEDIGVVGVLSGSADGLDATGAAWSGQAGDYFGGAATASDLDADGYPELSVGAPQANVFDVGGRLKKQAGQVLVYAGGSDGPGAEPVSITQDTEGVPGRMKRADRFGEYAP